MGKRVSDSPEDYWTVSLGDFVVACVANDLGVDDIVAGQITDVGDVLGEAAIRIDGQRILLGRDVLWVRNVTQSHASGTR